MRHAKLLRTLVGPGGLATSPAYADPIEGEFAMNAAAVLVVLGVWALLMGVRNLRSLRYKHSVPPRRFSQDDSDAADDVD